MTRQETWETTYIIRYHIAGQSLQLSTHHAGSTDVRMVGSSGPRACDILTPCKDVYDGASKGENISRECAKKCELSFTRNWKGYMAISDRSRPYGDSSCNLSRTDT